MQTSQISSKDKKESKKIDDHPNEIKPQSKDKDSLKKDGKSGSKLKEKPYWEPLIPRSGRKDRLEIW